jgi:hypothetical protein
MKRFTATSLSELLVGIELLPEGRRRSGLDQALSELVTRLFGPRALPFDQQAATFPLTSDDVSTPRRRC